MIYFIFKPEGSGRLVDAPGLGTGDIVRLKQLFPDNPIWKAKRAGIGNIYTPSDEDGRAFYDALVERYCKSELDVTSYPTGDSMSFGTASNNLVTLFYELIRFFETELGYRKPAELEERFALVQKRYEEQLGSANFELKRAFLDIFARIPDFKRPKDLEHQMRLGLKLDVYRERLAAARQGGVPATVDPVARSTGYKIDILSAVLALKDDQSVSLRKLATEALENSRHRFDPAEYYFACEVIAHYLGTPFPKSKLTKELPELKPDHDQNVRND